jgi:uncharacterized membrane protein YdjX (TVP38/TMEM64 family)
MKKWFKIVLIIVAVLIMGGITVLVFPYVASLSEEANRIAFQNYINSLGGWGILILFLIQMLQVIVAVIPGEPIEIISGIMYGTIGGLFLCLGGILISTVIIYFTVRKLGKNIINTKNIFLLRKFQKYTMLFDMVILDTSAYLSIDFMAFTAFVLLIDVGNYFFHRRFKNSYVLYFPALYKLCKYLLYILL